MKFSRNPISGEIESYSDEGVYAGHVFTMADFISQKQKATDGGPGSGNFGHSGRPGKVGGSGEGAGTSEPRKVPSGENKATELRKRYESAPDYKPIGGSAKFYDTEQGMFQKVFGGGLDTVGRVGTNATKEDHKNFRKKWYDQYLQTLEYNGDPSPESTGKKVMTSMGDVYRRKGGPMTHEDRAKFVEELGFKGEEAKEILSQLEQYTEGDWKNVDEDVLEEYIKKRPDVFGGKLYRGIHLKKDEFDKMMKELQSGAISFGHISSWSNNAGVAGGFATLEDKDKPIPDDEIPVVFMIPEGHSRTAVSVAEFSKWRESEAITGKDTSWSVVGVYDDEHGGRPGEKPRKGVTVVLMERGEEYDRQS